MDSGNYISDLFIRADLLDNGVPPWEQHVHSHHTDGKASIDALVKMAVKQDIKRLIFTEHTEPDLVSGPGWFDRYSQDVQAARARYSDQIDLRIGLEVPLIDYGGNVLLDEQMQEESAFFLGAVHSYPGHQWQDIPTLDPKKAIELEFKGLMALLDNPLVDAIAHAGGVCHTLVTPFPLELFDEVVRVATEKGKAIELNPAYHVPMDPYLAICQRHRALISPGSNAHKLHQVGKAFKVLRSITARQNKPGGMCHLPRLHLTDQMAENANHNTVR